MSRVFFSFALSGIVFIIALLIAITLAVIIFGAEPLQKNKPLMQFLGLVLFICALVIFVGCIGGFLCLIWGFML